MTEAQVDLAVIGAGPAGLAAASEARRLGLGVVLLDEQDRAGGQIYRGVEAAPADRVAILGPDYVAGRALAEEFRASGARHVVGATVWNLTTDATIDYVAGGRSTQVVARHALIATGAMERPFPIPGWTLPGVMTAGAAQILLKASGALPTQPVVLMGCGPLLYLLAWQYLRAGAPIRAVVDTTPTGAYWRAVPHATGALAGWRDLRKGLKLIATLRRSGVAIHSGCTDLAIYGTDRADGVSFTQGGTAHRIETAIVLLHQGVVPNTQLSQSTGAEHRWDATQLCWHPVTDDWGRLGETALYVAGDSRGIVGVGASAAQGRLAAMAIAERLGRPIDPARRADQRRALARATHIRPFLDTLYRPTDANRVPANDAVVVCRCEEVTAGQIRRCVALGCTGPNQTKAFVRAGMGPCQGRFCGLTVTEIIARERGVDPAQVGRYRVRSPVKPILLGELAADPL